MSKHITVVISKDAQFLIAALAFIVALVGGAVADSYGLIESHGIFWALGAVGGIALRALFRKGA